MSIRKVGLGMGLAMLLGCGASSEYEAVDRFMTHIESESSHTEGITVSHSGAVRLPSGWAIRMRFRDERTGLTVERWEVLKVEKGWFGYRVVGARGVE